MITSYSKYVNGEIIKYDDGSFGGIVGIGGDPVINSYYDTPTTKVTSSEGGEGKTTAQMKQKSTYKGWDFSSVWEITPGNYPTLK